MRNYYLTDFFNRKKKDPGNLKVKKKLTISSRKTFNCASRPAQPLFAACSALPIRLRLFNSFNSANNLSRDRNNPKKCSKKQSLMTILHLE